MYYQPVPLPIPEDLDSYPLWYWCFLQNSIDIADGPVPPRFFQIFSNRVNYPFRPHPVFHLLYFCKEKCSFDWIIFLKRCVISICELILTTKIKDYNDLKDQSLLSAFSDVYDTVWEAKTIIFQCIQCASLSHIEDAVVIKSPKIISIFWTYQWCIMPSVNRAFK